MLPEDKSFEMGVSLLSFLAHDFCFALGDFLMREIIIRARLLRNIHKRSVKLKLEG